MSRKISRPPGSPDRVVKEIAVAVGCNSSRTHEAPIKSCFIIYYWIVTLLWNAKQMKKYLFFLTKRYVFG